jgi:hypothetical protein
MDRLSGAYRRHAQKIAFLVALFIVVAANGDTFALVQKLWREPVQRQVEISLAQKSVERCTRGDDGRLTCPMEIFGDSLPLSWTRSDWSRITGTKSAALSKFFGLFITALAISIGSPFWFSLLKKIAPGWSMSGPQPPRAA